MKKTAVILSLLGAIALVSCTASQPRPYYTEKESLDLRNGAASPTRALYIVIDALEREDVETAKKCTLYAKYVDWDQVVTAFRTQPKRYRVRKILYSDPTPEQHNASAVYYKSADGKSNIVYFTKVNGRWYWGNELHTALGRIRSPEEMGKP